MGAEAWIGLVTAILAAVTIGVMYRLSPREHDEPHFSVLRRPTTTGWTVTAYNAGNGEAPLAWFELVPDPAGRASAIDPDTAIRVPAGGTLRAEVLRSERPRGLGVELCWLDRDREEHRSAVLLPEPEEPAAKSRKIRRRQS
ncbi:hypothetical protein [Cryptosporangium aurantiacum]|uniref:Uncharacterized protein n=1 Tax=Cryptosporangium aurantiacum TaxID=134849 RepID=A0A1M7QMI7_9ACTN|nr:hypothetical protein [Cryptosporangium aurantiacum]SHN32526.1 hypothetical protein SAMN05443668_10547 [Cryptosporangium aurantiacum]